MKKLKTKIVVGCLIFIFVLLFAVTICMIAGVENPFRSGFIATFLTSVVGAICVAFAFLMYFIVEKLEE